MNLRTTPLDPTHGHSTHILIVFATAFTSQDTFWATAENVVILRSLRFVSFLIYSMCVSVSASTLSTHHSDIHSYRHTWFTQQRSQTIKKQKTRLGWPSDLFSVSTDTFAEMEQTTARKVCWLFSLFAYKKLKRNSTRGWSRSCICICICICSCALAVM